MPSLIGGYTLQTAVPIDTRFVISQSTDRFNDSIFGTDGGLIFNGLTTYVTSSTQYFIAVDASQYTTSNSESVWRQIPLLSSLGSLEINGNISASGAVTSSALTIGGIGDVSASIASLEAGSGVRDLQDVTNQGAYTNITITASAGVVLNNIYAMTGSTEEGADAASAYPASRFNINTGGDFRFADVSTGNTNPIVSGGLAISGGNSNASWGDYSQAPTITVLNHGALVFSREYSGFNPSRYAAVLKFNQIAHNNVFVLSGSISASQGISASFAQFGSHTQTPNYIIESASNTTDLSITYHTETTNNFIAFSGSGTIFEDQSVFPTASEGALMVKDGVLYVGVAD
jgi:hypothetical protein